MHLRTLTTLYEALKTILALLHSIAQYYYKIRNSILLFNEDFFLVCLMTGNRARCF